MSLFVMIDANNLLNDYIAAKAIINGVPTVSTRFAEVAPALKYADSLINSPTFLKQTFKDTIQKLAGNQDKTEGLVDLFHIIELFISGDITAKTCSSLCASIDEFIPPISEIAPTTPISEYEPKKADNVPIYAIKMVATAFMIRSLYKQKSLVGDIMALKQILIDEGKAGVSKEEFNSLVVRVSNVETEVSELKAEVKGLKTEVSELKAEVSKKIDDMNQNLYETIKKAFAEQVSSQNKQFAEEATKAVINSINDKKINITAGLVSP